jgi:hypothetical protein
MPNYAVLVENCDLPQYNGTYENVRALYPQHAIKCLQDYTGFAGHAMPWSCEYTNLESLGASVIEPKYRFYASGIHCARFIVVEIPDTIDQLEESIESQQTYIDGLNERLTTLRESLPTNATSRRARRTIDEENVKRLIDEKLEELQTAEKWQRLNETKLAYAKGEIDETTYNRLLEIGS